MKPSAIPALMLLGLAATAALPAAAQPGPGHFHHGFGGPMLAGVTLTDAQRSRVEAIETSSRAQNKATFEQLRALHEQMETALAGTGSVTEAALLPLLQQQEALQAKLEQSRLENRLAIRNLLTPDQLSAASATHAKLAALHEQEHALMDHDAPPPPPPAE